MKVIIAGSRTITDYKIVKKAIEDSKVEITEVVSGGAKGVDSLGEKYAEENNISCRYFYADWKNINAPNAVVKENKWGKYNAKAGLNRNEEMAEHGDVLIAVWDGKSTGTKHMINCMEKLNKKVYIYEI